MTAGRTRPRDPNQLAKLIVDIATGEVDDAISAAKRHPDGNLHRPAGRKGGTARAAKLSPERRAEIAKAAAERRWGNKQSPREPRTVGTPHPDN